MRQKCQGSFLLTNLWLVATAKAKEKKKSKKKTSYTLSIMAQFYQHFMRGFFLRKLHAQPFYTYIFVQEYQRKSSS